jgi:hypothetical protein
MKLKPSDVGFIVFASVVAINAAVLALDAALVSCKLQSVTQFSRHNQWLAAIAILVNAAGFFGLMLHFSDFNGEHP